ncbi:hypothetical protein EYF80_050310 [Liparis tanakae]|uniref:Uncharacterized protein n=1 Tax=Liparis tanakae TaxID=230148 RepID=A0A4Z2FFL6_9TELE|nr:hypothetical protein EYF80_050310 [Liparis tanakae]
MCDITGVYLRDVRRHQSHIADRVPIQVWDNQNRQRAVQPRRLRLLPPDVTCRHQKKKERAGHLQTHHKREHPPVCLCTAVSRPPWDSRQQSHGGPSGGPSSGPH